MLLQLYLGLGWDKIEEWSNKSLKDFCEEVTCTKIDHRSLKNKNIKSNMHYPLKSHIKQFNVLNSNYIINYQNRIKKKVNRT